MKNNDVSSTALRLAALFTLLAGAAIELAAQPTPTRYVITGTVYSAAAIAPGEPIPRNPLSRHGLATTTSPNDPPGTATLVSKVVGPESHYAVEPRSFVLLSLTDAATGRQLGQDLTESTGAFTIEFLDPPSITATAVGTAGALHSGSTATVSFLPPVAERRVRFTARDAASGATLFESGPVPVFAGSNERWVLVPGAPVEAGRIKSLPPGSNAFTFTRVGKIELPNIQGGLARVGQVSQRDLAIPAYDGAPFGGNLFLFGGFSRDFYPTAVGQDTHCYQLLVDGRPLRQPLVKTRYTILAGDRVRTERVELGPQPRWGVHDCYSLTPISLAGGVFYSYPDLVGLWRTGAGKGMKEVEVKLWQAPARGSGAQATEVTTLSASSLELMLDNDPVELRFDKIEAPATASCGSSSGGGSRVDLLGEGNRCKVAQVGPGRGQGMNLAITVQHDHLRDWSLAIGSNGGHSALVDRDARSVSRKEYALSANDFAAPCAYSFSLAAWAKTTDGYGYIRRAYDRKAYYVLGGAP